MAKQNDQFASQAQKNDAAHVLNLLHKNRQAERHFKNKKFLNAASEEQLWVRAQRAKAGAP